MTKWYKKGWETTKDIASVTKDVGSSVRDTYLARKKKERYDKLMKKLAQDEEVSKPTESQTRALSAFYAAFGQDPVRGWILNADTEDGKQFLLNPEQLELICTAEYDESATFSMSHSDFSYKNSKREPFTLTLYTSRLLHAKRSKKGYDGAYDTMREYRYFLESLTVPDGKFIQSGYVGAEPPDVVIYFPGIATMLCRVRKVKETFQSFDRDGKERVVVFEIEVHEKITRRRWSDSVQQFGLR